MDNNTNPKNNCSGKSKPNNKKKPVNRRAVTSAYLLLTENCNLRCTYCFEGKTRCVNKYMSKETAFKTVDFLFNQAIENDADDIHITFFGGEPMLCPELMTDIIHYAEKQSKGNGKKAKYSIITNGTIYNEKVEKFLDVWRSYNNNRLDIQLSIDGIPEIQDINRPCAAETLVSSELVKEAVGKYKEYFKRNNVNPEGLHIHACVSKASLPRIYDSYVYFTRDLGIVNSNFAWVIEDNWDDKDLEIFSDQLQKITDRILKITTNPKRFPFKRFDCSSGCSGGQNLMAVDTEGYLYPCHRFFFNNLDNREDFILGNVINGITDVEKREQYIGIDYSKISPEVCQICIATNHACTGDIHKLANAYQPKFMNIINQYYGYFMDWIERKEMLKNMSNLAAIVKAQEEKIEVLENRLNKLEA